MRLGEVPIPLNAKKAAYIDVQGEDTAMRHPPPCVAPTR